jgi:formamidopyrimidine-DNA glycosylase
MLELPEASVIAKQLNDSVAAKTITRVVAAQSPHKFAWYTGDPAQYPELLTGKRVSTTVAMGGIVEIRVDDRTLVFSDGVNLRYHPTLAEAPQKHQLLIEFDDATALSATVAMYGGLTCFPMGANDNPYYLVAQEKPSPLSDSFSLEYFLGLFCPEHEKLSLKAFLATEQRIPGLGNGVLQDILYRAKLHPKRKVATLSAEGKDALFHAIKSTLSEMTEAGGRDTERDLFGSLGGYRTQMSKNTMGQTCLICGCPIQKQSYLSGSVYFCPGCQKEA